MFRTVKDLQVIKADELTLTVAVSGVSKPLTLGVRKYERGAVISIPWIWKDQIGYPDYEALKVVLRPHYGHIEPRTETDPRFVQAADAREERKYATPHAA